MERNHSVAVNIAADGIQANVVADTTKSEAEYKELAENYVSAYLKDAPVGKMLYNVCYKRAITDSDVVDSVLYNVELNEDGTPAFDEETLQRKRETEQYISQHEDFPEGIYLLITTSRNKEGINIKNKDYQWNMITESHYVEDIKQMWGRARSGLTAMEIVYDAPQFTKLYCRYEHNFLLSKHS